MKTSEEIMKAGEEEASKMKCPYCGGKVIFTTNDKIYKKIYGNGWVYMCVDFPKCNSFVGGHKNGNALGNLADQPTRIARKLAHDKFDPLWMGVSEDRNVNKKVRAWLYGILSDWTGLEIDQCHIGMMNPAQCKQVEEFVSKFREFLDNTKLPNNSLELANLKLNWNIYINPPVRLDAHGHKLIYRNDLAGAYECKTCEKIYDYKETK